MLQPQGKEPGQRDSTKNHGRLGGIRQTPGYLPKQPCHLPEGQVYKSCVLPAMTLWCRYLDTDQTSTEQTCDRTDQNGKKYAQHHIQRQKDQHLGQERTKVIDIINTVRQMKWSWAGHINRLKDDRWTTGVTTWRPYDKKIRQGRPAKRWRDDLDKYWSNTIWQRTAQDRLIWRRHAEAFAQPRDTTVSQC